MSSARAGRLRRASDQLAIYLPVILMAVLALGTYWLARNTPSFGPAPVQPPPTHDPDYFMRGFSVRNFDENGRLKTEVFGTVGRHFPDTDTMEIEQPRIRAFNERGELTVATARRALSNGDASEVQLFGNAVVTREANGERPRLEIRGDFLHAFVDTERVKSNKPVELIRGNDRFTADNLDYANLDRLLELQGRVRGVIMPPRAP